MTPRLVPTFGRHVQLLLGLRWTLGWNRSRARWLAALSSVAACAPALPLGLSAYALLRWPPIAASAHWPRFVLNLLGFVIYCLWCMWPLMSAGVDDHTEQSRYAAFPISPMRLMVASTLAQLFEPRALVLFSPLIGASLGYASVHPPGSALLAVGLGLAFVLFCAASGRVALHVMLNVLRQHRNAELLGGFFVATLALCSLIPPVDTSWLVQTGGTFQGVPDALVENAGVALGRVPSGFFGHGLLALGQGRWLPALADLLALVELSWIALIVAFGLLVQFYRQAGRSAARGEQARTANPFARARSLPAALLARELLDLWHNPKARLLAAVPFVLAIFVKVLSGRSLLAYVLGPSTDAWLLGGFCLYAAVVMCSTFAQNAFAYDGHGFSAMLAAPVSLAAVLRAKNAAHALAAFTVAAAAGAFYRVYFGAGTGGELAVAGLAVLTVVPVLLLAGNFLSVLFPVKFHASLKRRDKLPLTVSLLGMAAAGAGTAPYAYALRTLGPQRVHAQTLGLLALGALAAWGAYLLAWPVAVRLLEARREALLHAVTRE